MHRQEFTRGLQECQRIVIKVGTTTITKADGQIDLARLEGLASEALTLRQRGKQVLIVTSGAVGAGSTKLGLTHKPRTVWEKQAAAAVGQAVLMHHYDVAFSKHGLTVAQILLTREDVTDRRRYLSARNTILLLVEMGVVPVINENDTVTSEEIKFGDNDTLSALVAALVDADLLILLSDIDGLYTGDPRHDPASRLVPVVTELTPEVWSWAGKTRSTYSIGGMMTKLKAADIAMKSGTIMVIADGSLPDPCVRIASGDRIGTLFLPQPKRLSRRQQWIAFGPRVHGRIVIDDGAKDAIVNAGKSLLPGGIVSVEGSFTEGSVVVIVDQDGREIGRGIVNYPSGDIKRIAGHKSAEIEELLGYRYSDEVVHRDNMSVIREAHAGHAS